MQTGAPVQGGALGGAASPRPAVSQAQAQGDLELLFSVVSISLLPAGHGLPGVQLRLLSVARHRHSAIS